MRRLNLRVLRNEALARANKKIGKDVYVRDTKQKHFDSYDDYLKSLDDSSSSSLTMSPLDSNDVQILKDLTTTTSSKKRVLNTEILKVENRNVLLVVRQNTNSVFYTAYIVDKNVKNLSEDDILCYTTHNKNNIVGIDTNHSFNENETLSQQKEDAILQIKSVIRCLERIC
jgi:hypothetical protein